MLELRLETACVSTDFPLRCMRRSDDVYRDSKDSGE